MGVLRTPHMIVVDHEQKLCIWSTNCSGTGGTTCLYGCRHASPDGDKWWVKLLPLVVMLFFKKKVIMDMIVHYIVPKDFKPCIHKFWYK
jgi:hypothetical protein